MGKTWFLWCRCAFSFGFFLFFYLQTSVALSSRCWRVSRKLGPWISRNLIITQDLHQWGRTNFGPAHTTEPPEHKPLVVNVIVVGPFEEKEEGTGVASDVVKVEGEDPDTPGYLRGDRVRLGRRRSRIVGASPLVRSRCCPVTVHNDSLISVWLNKATHMGADAPIPDWQDHFASKRGCGRRMPYAHKAMQQCDDCHKKNTGQHVCSLRHVIYVIWGLKVHIYVV